MSIHKVGDLDGKIDFGDRLHEASRKYVCAFGGYMHCLEIDLLSLGWGG